MIQRSILLTILLAAGLALAAPSGSFAQTAAEDAFQSDAELGIWIARAARAYDAEEHDKWVEALENLHRIRPFNADFMRQLVTGYALTGQTSKAFNMMLRMQQQGLAVDWSEVEGVESLRQYSLYDHLANLMATAGEPFGKAEPFAEIPGRHSMPEALAMDAESGRLFVGTVREGQILVRGPDSERFEEFAGPDSVPGLMAVFDLLADPERGHLWVASGSTSQYRGASTANFGRTSLIKLDLATGEKLDEYRVMPDGKPHLLGAMTQAEDGTIYASDSLTPLIYRLEPGAERPEIFAGNPIFSGLRGLALSADEERLYVSDYELGLFFFEMDEQRRGYAIGVPETLNIGGIDGLYRWEDSLVAVQNGISPSRVLRLDLDDSGTRVASLAPLVVAHPRFDIPTFGTVAGDDIVFLASSHWDKVDEKGRPMAGSLPSVAVLRSSIDEAENLVVGDEVLEQLKRDGRPVQQRPGALDRNPGGDAQQQANDGSEDG